ncbi:MAG: MarR family transcriptional regulator [Planctomycetota bacterium]
MARSLREQIGKKQPFEQAEEEAYLNIVRTAAALQCEFQRLFKQHGLGESGYNVLRILHAAGRDGRTWSEIRGEMVVPAPDATRVIARLERDELVTREPDAADGRVIRVRITRRGSGLIRRLQGPVRALHDELLGHVPDGELRRLSRLLERTRDG